MQHWSLARRFCVFFLVVLLCYWLDQRLKKTEPPEAVCVELDSENFIIWSKDSETVHFPDPDAHISETGSHIFISNSECVRSVPKRAFRDFGEQREFLECLFRLRDKSSIPPAPFFADARVVRFQPDELDAEAWYNFSSASPNPSRLHRWIRRVMSLLETTTVLGISAALLAWGIAGYAAYVEAALLFCAGLFAWRVFAALFIKRACQSNSRWWYEYISTWNMQVAVLPGRLIVRTERAAWTFFPAAIQDCREGAGHFLVRVKRGFPVFIPKRAFASTEECDAFAEDLFKLSGKTRPPRETSHAPSPSNPESPIGIGKSCEGTVKAVHDWGLTVEILAGVNAYCYSWELKDKPLSGYSIGDPITVVLSARDGSKLFVSQ